jgi:hypothetical protein
MADRDSEIYCCGTISMHVLQFFLTRPSAAMQGCAPARRRIRVLAVLKQPSLWISDLASRDRDNLNSTLTVLGQSSISRLDPRVPFKSLIEKASGPHYLSPKCPAGAFPIKASGKPGVVCNAGRLPVMKHNVLVLTCSRQSR